MSRKAAHYVITRIQQASSFNLGLATGGTPLGLYKQLVEDHHRNNTTYRHVKTFNLDEYVGLDGMDRNSYRYYMNERFFKHIDIEKENTFIPRGTAENMEKEALDYEMLIKEHGGIDLQVLGIGTNGHIGFNEPGTSFHSTTHIVELTDSTRKANARFFKSLEEVPTKAITMGIGTIMRSNEILLLVSGENKSNALYQLLYGECGESFPASILRKHQAVTVIADQGACAKIKVKQ